MLGRLVNTFLDARGVEAPWSRVKPLIASADVFLFNLECAICGDLPKWRPLTKPFHFRLEPRHVATLRESGVHGASLANNHVADHGFGGLVETLSHLDDANIVHAGAGIDRDAAQRAVILPSRKARIALVSAADHPVEWAASSTEPGIFIVDPSTPDGAREASRVVTAARDAGADIVILALHWGPNMRRVPPPHFERFAHAMVDAGADIVWGTSAHIPQGIEFYHDRLILYDTGDFVDDYAVDPHERNDLSFLYRVNVDGARPTSVDLSPVRITRGVPEPIADADARWLVATERRLCEPFGTVLIETDAFTVRASREPHVTADARISTPHHFTPSPRSSGHHATLIGGAEPTAARDGGEHA